MKFLTDDCQLPVDPGPCDNTNERYFYDYASKECKEFNYGGCHGNENNYISMFSCIWHCESKLSYWYVACLAINIQPVPFMSVHVV